MHFVTGGSCRNLALQGDECIGSWHFILDRELQVYVCGGLQMWAGKGQEVGGREDGGGNKGLEL